MMVEPRYERREPWIIFMRMLRNPPFLPLNWGKTIHGSAFGGALTDEELAQAYFWKGFYLEPAAKNESKNTINDTWQLLIVSFMPKTSHLFLETRDSSHLSSKWRNFAPWLHPHYFEHERAHFSSPLVSSFWACACKLSWTPSSRARAQPTI